MKKVFLSILVFRMFFGGITAFADRECKTNGQPSGIFCCEREEACFIKASDLQHLFPCTVPLTSEEEMLTISVEDSRSYCVLNRRAMVLNNRLFVSKASPFCEQGEWFLPVDAVACLGGYTCLISPHYVQFFKLW